MATIKRFEELEIWKDARVLHNKVRDVTVNTGLSKDFALKNQILGSSGSVMDNISEGFERDGKKEFLNFLHISKGSLGETRSQVYRTYDAAYITEEKFYELLNDCLKPPGSATRSRHSPG